MLFMRCASTCCSRTRSKSKAQRIVRPDTHQNMGSSTVLVGAQPIAMVGYKLSHPLGPLALL